MSLSSALDSAKSSLAASQAQTAVLSRNIANVNTEGATRKYANVVTGAYGQVQVTSVTQSSNTVLFRNMLDANSAVSKGNVISNGLTRISETLGDTELSRSPAALITAFGDSLNTLAASPNNYELARSSATAARDVVTSLNEASNTTQTIRRDADAELVSAADDMNKILAKIEDLNKQIVAGTRNGTDVTDLNDERDRQVAALSSYVGVTSQTRGDNDLVLYTDSGVTLFETTARKIEYSGTPGLNATITEGNAFRIDGVAVTGSNAFMPIKSGSVAGLVTLRDDTMVTYQAQLDEIARGLVEAFAETEQPAGTNPRAGLFTSSDPALLPDLDGSTVDTKVGLAGSLKLADGVAANPFLIRDGGINDNDANPATVSTYKYNTTDAGSYTVRLNQLTTALNASRSFSATSGADPDASIADYAASSVSWLQANRQESLSETEYRETLLEQTKTTLSNETGINMEEQLTRMTELERSYQAASKLIATIDEMLKTLIDSI